MRAPSIAFLAVFLAVPASSSDFDAAAAQVSKEIGVLSKDFSKKMKSNAISRAAISAAAAPRYSTRCEIREGTGYGYVTNHGRERLRLRGRIYWYFYDEDGDEVDDDRDRISERISRGDTELVDEEDAPDDAVSCAIDVSEAVEAEEEEEEEDGNFSASCQLEDGRGVGYITVRDTSSIRFRGRVTYYFYDSRGRETDRERDRISVRVRRNQRERVGDVDAPSDAVSCSLDISETERS
jgi:hypothetical protein